MQHVEFFCRVPAGVEQNSLLASRVVWEEAGDIQHLTVYDDPAVVLLVVLRNFILGKGFRTRLRRRAFSLRRCGGRRRLRITAMSEIPTGPWTLTYLGT